MPTTAQRPAPKLASNAGSAPADEPAAPAAAPKKRWKTILVVSLAVLLAVGISSGATWYFTRDSGEDKASAAPGKAKGKVREKESSASHKPPVFVNLEPFTVNLAAEGSERYLQTTIVLQMSDDKAAEALKVYMPVMRNRVLMLLSSRRPSELESSEGKQKLVNDLVAAMREAVPGSTAESGATGALLSSFVIQ